MRTPLLIALMLLGTAPAWAAEEPSGCDKFKWNIDRERAALIAPDRVNLASGGDLTEAIGLVAAIPAVLAYNKISNDLARFAARLEGFGAEFSAILSRQSEERG